MTTDNKISAESKKVISSYHKTIQNAVTRILKNDFYNSLDDDIKANFEIELPAETESEKSSRKVQNIFNCLDNIIDKIVDNYHEKKDELNENDKLSLYHLKQDIEIVKGYLHEFPKFERYIDQNYKFIDSREIFLNYMQDFIKTEKYNKLTSKINNLSQILHSYHFAHKVLLNMFGNPIYFNNNIIDSKTIKEFETSFINFIDFNLSNEDKESQINFKVATSIWKFNAECKEHLKSSTVPENINNINLLCHDLSCLYKLIFIYEKEGINNTCIYYTKRFPSYNAKRFKIIDDNKILSNILDYLDKGKIKYDFTTDEYKDTITYNGRTYERKKNSTGTLSIDQISSIVNQKQYKKYPNTQTLLFLSSTGDSNINSYDTKNREYFEKIPRRCSIS